MPLPTYESCRQKIKAQWPARQRSGNPDVERLSRRMLFRLIHPPDLALTRLAALVQEVRDSEARLWYENAMCHLANLSELRSALAGRAAYG